VPKTDVTSGLHLLSSGQNAQLHIAGAIACSKPGWYRCDVSRPRPTVSDHTSAFWKSGADRILRIARCQTCRLWLHPPQPVCPACRDRSINPEGLSGRGTVWSWTINRYRWGPELEPPNLIAEVELDEQPGLRLLTSVVGCESVTIGMPVVVDFEPAGDMWAPVFRPEQTTVSPSGSS
jgi:uncharacterized OB-fold protein